MKKTSPTIRDVAAAAGISVATVSKSMNGLAGKNDTEYSLLEPRLVVRESTMRRPGAPHFDGAPQERAAPRREGTTR
jgi:hypothetical protein